MRLTSQVRRLAAIAGAPVVVIALMVPAVSAGASSPRLGTVPPADPTYYCDPQLSTPLADINYCRAKEGIGPMTLPSNYSTLTVPQQQLVVFNLERVNRGEAPIVGLNAALDTLSQQGADGNADPVLPSSPSGGAASIWAAESSTLGAVDDWMYTDECSPTNVVGCWGHRDGILINSQSDPLVAGAGFTPNGWHSGSFTANSYAAEFVYNYQPDQLDFTWASELSFFSSPPTTEPLNGPTPSPSPSTSTSTSPSASPTPSPSSSPSKIVLTKITPHETARSFSRFPKRLAVKATRAGNPVARLEVAFAVSGSCLFPRGGTARTNSSGVARASTLRGTYRGPCRVTASAGDAKRVTWKLRVTR